MSQSRVRSACRWHRGSCCEVLLLQNTKVQDVQLPPLPRLRKLNLAYCRVQNTMLRRAASASGTKGRTQAMVALQKERRARRLVIQLPRTMECRHAARTKHAGRLCDP